MTATSNNRVREIESWFHDHDDGEFVVASSEAGSSIVGDSSAARTVIYTTKFHCLNHNLRALDVAHPVMIVGRYGLPVSADLIHLDALPVGTRCYFVGDADPPDILAFAWLREHAAIGWLGVNDKMLTQSLASDLTSLEIAMSDAEKLTIRSLPDLCPDFRDLLGPYCSGTLDRGFKIELEAAMICLGSRPKD
ncbi:MAG: hypothetical protein NTY19_04680 [Planctomycetota bacterium]|nr:hypothetical protein [Planctomycetota bacterium]